MPTYEYKREDGSIFEIRQGINDQPLKSCPETGQKVTRIISGGGGVVYKGDGWYVTDYKDSRKGGDSTSETGSANGSNSESKSSDAGDSTASSTPTAAKKSGD